MGRIKELITPPIVNAAATLATLVCIIDGSGFNPTPNTCKHATAGGTYMGVGQFQYPTPFIFGNLPSICQLIWKKGAFWNAERLRRPENTALAHLLICTWCHFRFSREKKRIFGTYFACFPFTNYEIGE